MTVSISDLLNTYGSPLYVYDLGLIRQQAAAIQAAFCYQPTRFLYAIKANPCPPVVRTLSAAGFGIDAVSPGEVAMALRLGIRPQDILYTENNMTDAEMRQAMDQGVLITCGSLDRLAALAAAGATEAAVRFNPRIGDSEHAKTLTAGPLTKFGIHHSQVDEVLAIERDSDLRVVGCHMHIGSGSLDAEAFVAAMQVILEIAARLTHLRFIDFGGGIGIPYREDQQGIDLPALGARAAALMEDFCASYGRRLELRLEPGRFPVAEAGTLYTTVTSVKTNPAEDGHPARTFVGTDTGFNHLVRPCMYGSYHPITNISRPEAPPQVVDVVGNICESGDIFARDRSLPLPQPGDILAIGCAGAYGMSMASTYNLRPLPAEVVIDGDTVTLARPRTEIADLLDAWC